MKQLLLVLAAIFAAPLSAAANTLIFDNDKNTGNLADGFGNPYVTSM